MDIRNKSAIQELLQSPETLGTVINAIIVANYGEDAYDWDPLTVSLELKADFDVDPVPEVLDRWCAMQVLMGSDAFFRRIDAFLGICNTLASGEPFFSAFDPVTVDETAWTLAEASMNRDLLEFSPTVRSYVQKRLNFEGFEGNPPEILAEMFKNRPKSEEIREGLASLDNKDAVSATIDARIGQLIAQFGKIPDLSKYSLTLVNEGLGKILKV